MKISLDGLLVLDAIARKGSFAAAAEELHRVPSAITYTVQKLEQDLGVTLFDRSGHRARLTAAGEELLKEGRHLLRAAVDLECRVQRVAKGWETELRVAYDDVISAEQLAPLIAEFYEQASGTRLRFGTEVLGDAGMRCVRPRGPRRWCAVRPAAGSGLHGAADGRDRMGVRRRAGPSAGCPRPAGLGIRHPRVRVVIVADSSRNLPPRSSGLAPGPDSLTVSTLRAKLAAQIAGLGVGFLPAPLAAPALADGRLVKLEVEEPKPRTRVHFAWRPRDAGKALKWWVAKLEDETVRERLLGAA